MLHLNKSASIQQKNLASLGLNIPLTQIPAAVNRIEQFTLQKLQIALAPFEQTSLFDRTKNKAYLNTIIIFFTDLTFEVIQKNFLQKNLIEIENLYKNIFRFTVFFHRFFKAFEESVFEFLEEK